MNEVSVAEPDVQPRRIECRNTRNYPFDFRKIRVNTLNGAQVKLGNLDVEVMESRESGIQDVELAFAGNRARSARHVLVVVGERHVGDTKVRDRASRSIYDSR